MSRINPTNIKIILSKNETIEEAEEKLFKALNAQRSGEIHTEDFHDPAMRSVVQKMINLHSQMINKAIKDIEKELDGEK